MTDWYVRVPASTSNLGPGFDVLGMAVDVFLDLRFESGGDSFRLVREGTLAELEGPPEADLTVQALSESLEPNPQGEVDMADPLGRLPPGTLTLCSEIPVGRGLGSSGAARTAGRILGLLLAEAPVDRNEVVDWVARREGHPDNAAPAVLGGLVAAWRPEDGPVRSVPLPVSGGLGWAFAAPGVSLATQASREALPEAVPHQTAVRNAARLALLLPALAAGDGPLIADAMVDEIHVPFRLPLIPGAPEAVEAGRKAGAWAVTLSGAGSGLVAVTPPDRAWDVGEVMARAFEAATGDEGGVHRVIRPWSSGAVWSDEPLSDAPNRIAEKG